MNGRYLNSVAQGLVPFQESIAHFERLAAAEQAEVLGLLEFIANQASATAADSAVAITEAGLIGFSPLWIPNESCSHACADYKKTSNSTNEYRYLMRLYSIADARRRQKCAGNCSHWWHNLQKNETR